MRAPALLAVLSAAAPAAAQCSQKIEAPAPTVGDGFGRSVALDGAEAAVGNPMLAPTGSAGPGEVVLLARQGAAWITTDVLTTAVPEPAMGLGYAIDRDGAVVAAGAPFSNALPPLSGQLHVFERDGTTWTEAVLLPADATSHMNYGRALALDGARLAVGAPKRDVSAFDSGAVDVWERVGGAWTFAARVTPPSSGAGYEFGSAVALDGDVLVAALEPTFSAAVHVFRRSGTDWTHEQALAGSAADDWGYALDLDGTRLAVGAPLEDSGVGLPASGGAVHLLEWDGATWAPAARLVDPDGVVLGWSVALGVLGVAAGDPMSGGFNSGGVHVFREGPTGWVVDKSTTNPNGGLDPQARLGTSVALGDDGTVLGGAVQDPFVALAPGSVWFLNDAFAPLSYCAAKTTSEGCTPDLWTAAGGAASASAPGPYLLYALNLRANVPGLLFFGLAPAAIPFQGGTLCASPPLLRTAPSLAAGFGACGGILQFDVNAFLASGPPLPPLGFLYAQAWFRDPPDATGVGLTDALRFQHCP